MTTMYPRFLGMDGHGDLVWELANGRWTWGDGPVEVARRAKVRTFEPVRYIEKYGRPIGLDETIDRKADAGEDPAELVKMYAAPEPAEESLGGIMAARKSGGHKALALMLDVLDSWIGGAQENHEALNHRGESRGEECWRSFAPSDIRNMINDAARDLGLTEFPAPAKPMEDEVR